MEVGPSRRGRAGQRRRGQGRDHGAALPAHGRARGTAGREGRALGTRRLEASPTAPCSTTSARSASRRRSWPSPVHCHPRRVDGARRHPEIGERICHPLGLSRSFASIVRHHHERWDGFGYPDRIAGEAIPAGRQDRGPGRCVRRHDPRSSIPRRPLARRGDGRDPHRAPVGSSIPNSPGSSCGVPRAPRARPAAERPLDARGPASPDTDVGAGWRRRWLQFEDRDDPKTLVVEALFALVFLSALRTWWRHRDPLSRDVVIVFSAMASLLGLGLLELVVKPIPTVIASPPRCSSWASRFPLHSTRHLHPVPEPVLRAAVVGWLATAVPLIVAGATVPTWLALAAVAVFVVTEVAAAAYLAAAARRRTGPAPSGWWLAARRRPSLRRPSSRPAGDASRRAGRGSQDVARVAALLAAIGYSVAFLPPGSSGEPGRPRPPTRVCANCSRWPVGGRRRRGRPPQHRPPGDGGERRAVIVPGPAGERRIAAVQRLPETFLGRVIDSTEAITVRRPGPRRPIDERICRGDRGGRPHRRGPIRVGRPTSSCPTATGRAVLVLLSRYRSSSMPRTSPAPRALARRPRASSSVSAWPTRSSGAHWTSTVAALARRARQERLRGQHEPRVPHAAERDPRVQRADARRAGDRRPGVGARRMGRPHPSRWGSTCSGSSTTSSTSRGSRPGGSTRAASRSRSRPRWTRSTAGLRPLADRKSIPCGTDVAARRPSSTHRGRLRQILYNLLSNAIKYTPDGGSITVARSTGRRSLASPSSTRGRDRAGGPRSGVRGVPPGRRAADRSPGPGSGWR